QSYDERKQKMAKEYETTYHYWRTGNIDGFIGLILPQISNQTKVHKDRNEKWLPKMVAAMREKPTMFVFGSGHLIGEYGIIHLLRAAGYEVEQIKIQ
ncbi:MAG: TraB/GumN family protein, partial [Prevotella sp.]|nr:TraB/GumN family protein [Prevotella sp.]